jgi:hypothetical protein
MTGGQRLDHEAAVRDFEDVHWKIIQVESGLFLDTHSGLSTLRTSSTFTSGVSLALLSA